MCDLGVARDSVYTARENIDTPDARRARGRQPGSRQPHQRPFKALASPKGRRKRSSCSTLCNERERLRTGSETLIALLLTLALHVRIVLYTSTALPSSSDQRKRFSRIDSLDALPSRADVIIRCSPENV